MYYEIDYYIMLVVAVVALAKEVIYDGLMKKGTPEALDMIMTVAGGLSLYVFEILIH